LRLTAGLKICLAILGAQKGKIQIYDPIQGTLRIAAYKGFGPEFLNKFRRVKPGQESVCAQALERREIVVCEDVFKDDRFADLRSIFMQEQLTAVISIPMVARGGALLGMFSAHFDRPHSPGLTDVRLIERYTGKLANVLQRERALAAL
jgi:GAF domain-containing protein